MGIKFSNNASANIIRALTPTATSVSVTAGKGALFPSLIEGDYFYATLAGNKGLEIVKVTNRVNDTMTIVRAQDNTTALSFDTGDLFELRIVAADFNDTFSEVSISLNETITSVNDTLDTTVESINNTINTTVTNVNNSLASTESTLNSSMSELRTEYTEAITALQNKHDEDLNDVFNQLNKIEVFPPQTDHIGESLTTDGTSVSWWPIAQDILDAAEEATSSSEGTSDFYEPLLGEVKHEMGSWWFSIDGSIPAGGLPHLGHLVSRSAYDTGWTWIEMNKTIVSDEEWLAYAESHNGTCPYYSYGDGSTTFRTPSYDQSFLKVLASISGFGGMEEAGLPNITGTIGDVHNSIDNADGAFSSANTGTVSLFGTVAGGCARFTFDASRSHPIYGNSDTVTPQNYGIIVGIYLVGAVSSPIGETDAAGLLNGLSTLESRTGALENGVGRAKAYIVETWSSGASWYRKWSDGWVEQGGQGYDRSPGGTTISFTVPFSNDNYTLSDSRVNNHTAALWACGVALRERSATGFKYANESGSLFSWYACGY